MKHSVRQGVPHAPATTLALRTEGWAVWATADPEVHIESCPPQVRATEPDDREA